MLTPNGQLSKASYKPVSSTHGGNSRSGDGQAELVDCLAVSVLRRQLSVGLIWDCECAEVAEFEQSIFDLITGTCGRPVFGPIPAGGQQSITT